MKRFAIYSSIVGEYDDVRQPLIIDDRFDYILFSDTITEPFVGVWKILPSSYSSNSNKLISSFSKCNADKVLSEYEASLWIDGTMQIASTYVYDRFIELFENRVEWAGIKHPSQDCIYDEMCAIAELRWVTDVDVVECYTRFKKNGFPENWGLYETNIIYRKHTMVVSKVNHDWWKEMEKGCKRDQFSLMPYLRKYQPKMDYFLSNGECPRLQSKNFNYFEHNPHKRVLKLSFHEMMRFRIIRTMYPHNKRKGYHEMFDWVSRFNNPKLMLSVWEILHFIKWAPKLLFTSIRNRI